MSSHWPSYSLSTGDRPLVAEKESIFKFKTMTENSCFAKVSGRFFKIIFYLTSWFMLKQLDNLPLLSMSNSLGLSMSIDNSGTLSIC